MSIDSRLENVIFVRKSRWNLGSPYLSSSFVKSVDFDFVKRQIHMEYYEIESVAELTEWLNTYRDRDTLTFTAYDGVGGKLYEQDFGKLFVLSDTASFDHDVTDPSIRKITLGYGTTSRRSFPMQSRKGKD